MELYSKDATTLPRLPKPKFRNTLKFVRASEDNSGRYSIITPREKKNKQ